MPSNVFTESAFKEADRIRDGSLTYIEFATWARESKDVKAVNSAVNQFVDKSRLSSGRKPSPGKKKARKIGSTSSSTKVSKASSRGPKTEADAAKDIQRLYRGKKGRRRHAKKRRGTECINLSKMPSITVTKSDIKHLRRVYDDIDGKLSI